MPSSFLLVFSTVSSLSEARRLAVCLVEAKLAACVNIIPSVESHYIWKGKRERSRECLLMIKTREAQYRKLEKRLKQEHSYDVPEIIACPIKRGNPDYLKWAAGALV